MHDHDFWTDRLSDWIDGHLEARESDAVAAHVAGCEACGDLTAELRDLRDRARALGTPEPAHDLWPSIRARLGEDPMADEVIDLTRRLPVEARRRDLEGGGPVARMDSGVPVDEARGGVRLTIPQLAAAALVLLLGGWTLGAVVQDAAAPMSPAVAAAPPNAVVREASTMVGAETLGDRVAELERTLRARSTEIDDATAATLERNLALIDRALSESMEALRSAPENAYLRDHIAASLRRREAALASTVRLLDRGD